MPAKGRLSILLSTWEGGGSVPPVLTVASKLLERGHRVRVMSEACSSEDVIASGAEFRCWTRAPSKAGRTREFEFFQDWTAASAADGIAMLIDQVMVGPAADYARDVIEELRADPADLVLTSEMLPGVMMGCEALGQRYGILTANLCVYPLMSGIPPMGPGLLPAASPEEEQLHGEMRAGFEATLDARLPRLNEARTSLGLPPLAGFLDQIRRAECYLLGTAQAFDFPASEMPRGFRYVGPQLSDTASQPFDHPFPGDPRPFALVAFSTSFQDHAGAVQRTIDAMAGLPMTALVTLGGSLRADELCGAENVAIASSAPHSEVMRHARLAVTHGGHGTVMKALMADLPMLVLPHGRDQGDNAVRVTARGAGLSLPATASTEDIRAALCRLLEEPDFTSAAAELGRRIRRESARTEVVSVIEEVVAASARRLPATG